MRNAKVYANISTPGKRDICIRSCVRAPLKNHEQRADDYKAEAEGGFFGQVLVKYDV
jgi:hypothetical protein